MNQAVMFEAAAAGEPYHVELPDGNFPFQVSVYGDFREGTSAVLLCNGLIEGRASMRRMAPNLVRAMGELREGDGRAEPIAVAAYDDPHTGDETAFRQDYRTARVVQVAEYLAAMTGRRLDIVGHSRGTISGVRAAGELGPELVSSFTDVNGAGHLHPVEAWLRGNPLNVPAKLAGAAAEMIKVCVVRRELGGLSVLGNMAATCVEHMGADVLAAVREMSDIGWTKITDDMVELDGVLEGGVWSFPGRYDELLPGGAIRRQLVEAGFPADHIEVLDTNHFSPLVRYDVARRICRRLAEVPRDEPLPPAGQASVPAA